MELFSQSALLTCPPSQSLKSRVRFVDFSTIILPKRLQFSTQPQNLRHMEPQRTVSCVFGNGENGSGSPVTTIPEAVGRIGEVKRVTKETNVYVKLNLDGSGIADSSTSIPFLDHMLDQLASHGLFDVHVRASGDTHIDDHHTNEDVALAIGTVIIQCVIIDCSKLCYFLHGLLITKLPVHDFCSHTRPFSLLGLFLQSLLQALGDRKGINRFGDFSAPLDEALIHVSLDLSGRPHLSYDLQIPTARVGRYDTQLVEHFFQSIVNTSGMTLHIQQLAGKNSHHIIEATFKTFARALRKATEYDPRRLGSIPSSKGVLSRS
ncbi:imidazoleglycerol-phosphate dehydratase 1, chloroplastic-like isoform X2 [Telopea speciosissima]|uniref:imidazoleglycerol-phosphate dehydratase 1, chloroplastic-like isoform X2 n=1 Tax=Telopea speciosissima TaxID=54955 RepID=UPI001CC75513|nr:imidazoleglycerol-phosphate dehydratase 1, chloroplastic-like isoform X2 [Telopea speciosissima]